VDILAPSERIHVTGVSRTEARRVWATLLQKGWMRASDQDVLDHQMSFGRLLHIAYGQRR